MKSPKKSVRSLQLQSHPERLPFLRLYLEEKFLRSLRIEPGTYVVGRDLSADVVLEEKSISRRHFQIEYLGENRLYVQDLGSSNGTFLGGKRVGRAALGHGDAIQVGPLRFVVSHKAFARPNVIPFPNVPTDPDIHPKEVVRSRRRRLWLQIPLALFSIFAAAGVAWRMQEIVAKKPAVVLAVKEAPKPVEKLPEVPVATTAAPIALKPSVRSKKGVPTVTPKPNRTPEDFISRVGRSLDDLSNQSDLKSAGSGLKRGGESAEPRTFESRTLPSTDRQTLDVDISLPSASEIKAIQKARSGNVERSAPFDPKAYRKMLMGRMEGVEECYVQFVPDGRAGVLQVELMIARNGLVSVGKLKGQDFGSKGLERCVAKKLSGLRVDPPPWDGFGVTYAFRFGRKKIVF